MERQTTIFVFTPRRRLWGRMFVAASAGVGAGYAAYRWAHIPAPICVPIAVIGYIPAWFAITATCLFTEYWRGR